MSEGKFFAFTLGTLAVLIAISVIGYIVATPVRNKTVEVTIGGGPEPAPV